MVESMSDLRVGVRLAMSDRLDAALPDIRLPDNATSYEWWICWMRGHRVDPGHGDDAVHWNLIAGEAIA
jgi:hypothetical protein